VQDEKEIIVELEKQKGKIKKLETVLQMFMAESKRRFEQQEKIADKLGDMVKEISDGLGDRMNSLERKMAYFMGGLAVLTLLFQILIKIFFK